MSNLDENVALLATRIGEEFASLKSSSVTNEGASSSGSVITLTDADDANLLSLTIYGKSTQDSTPSPESPVDIESIADDGDLSVYTAGQNLMPPVVEAGTTVTHSNGLISIDVSADSKTFTVHRESGATGNIYFNLAHPVRFPAGSYIHSRNETGSYQCYLCFRNSIKSGYVVELYDGTIGRISSPDGLSAQTFDQFYIYVGSAATDTEYVFTPSVELTSEVTDFEAYKGTYADISDIEPLRAVPTTQTEGNYVDADGTKWWADKLIVRSDGSGYIDRICEEYIIDDTATWRLYSNNQHYGFYVTNIGYSNHGLSLREGFADFGKVRPDYKEDGVTIWLLSAPYVVNTGYYDADTEDTDAALTSWAEVVSSNGPFHIVTYCTESTKEELTSDQVTALLALQTYTDTTHIYNEESADMEVEYVQAGKTSITQILSQSVASTSARGVVELATAEETEEGTDETRAVTPYAGEQVYLKKSGGTVSGDLTVEGTLNADSLSIDGYVAESAEKLENPVTIQTNLASTTAASFDGTTNVTPGVTGVLPVANGGTGSTAGAVLLTGAQTVAGTKTFSSVPWSSAGSFRASISGVTKGTAPDTTKYGNLAFYDGSGGTDTSDRLGIVEVMAASDGVVRTDLVAYEPTNGSTVNNRISIGYDADGAVFTRAPTPPSGDSSTKIATTAWVNNALSSGNAGTASALENPVTIQTNLASTTAASFDGTANVTPGVTGVLPVANGGTGSTAGAVLLTGAQTVAGTKTFSSYVVTDGGSYRVDMSADEPGTTHTLMYVKPYGYSYTPILRAVEPNGEGYGVISDFGSRGNSIFGAGEGQESLLSDLATDGSENAYVCADSQVRVVTNANTYDNRGVLNFSSSGDSFYIWHYPRIAEVYKGDTPTTGFNTQVALLDSTGTNATANKLSALTLNKSTTRNGAELQVFTDTSGSTSYAVLGIYAPNGGGTAYTYAPTPASGDSSTKIATTAWVNAAIKAAIAEALGTASSAAVSAVSDTASSETISATSDAVRSAESDDQENE